MTVRIYEQFELSPEMIEPVVCEQRQVDLRGILVKIFCAFRNRKLNTHGTRSTFPRRRPDSRSIRTSVCLRCYRTCYTLGTGSRHPSSPPRHRLPPSIRTDCASACPHCRRGGYSCPTPTIHPRHSSPPSIPLYGAFSRTPTQLAPAEARSHIRPATTDHTPCFKRENNACVVLAERCIYPYSERIILMVDRPTVILTSNQSHAGRPDALH